MSNIHELPDLAGDVRDRAVPPPYEQVTRRVRARRLRTVTGTLAATALAVGGLAVWQSAATTTTPSPNPPITQPADPAYPASPAWRQVVGGTDSHPFETEGTDDGSIAVVWRALEHPEPTFALVIREADGTVHGRRIDAPLDLTPVPGGWVGVRTAQVFFIGSEGSWTDLGTPADPRESAPGDVVVSVQFGRWLYRPDDRSWSTMLFEPTVDQAFVTDIGDDVSCAADGTGRVNVYDLDRGGRANPDLPGFGCLIAGNGGNVVVAALGDEPDGEVPLTGLLRSTDGGYTWQRDSFEPLGGVTSVVVTSGGDTLVSGADGNAFLLTANANGLIEPDRPIGLAFTAGDRVYALSYAFARGPLLYSDDDGRTWQETTLPGMESSAD